MALGETIPEPKPDQLATQKFVSKGNPKPSLGPEYFKSVGDSVYKPEFWVGLMKRLLKGDLYHQETAYQAGLFIRQLGEENGAKAIKALEQADKQIKDIANNKREEISRETDPKKQMELWKSPEAGLGLIVQFPREMIETAYNDMSAKDVVPESVAKPLKRPGTESTPEQSDIQPKPTTPEPPPEEDENSDANIESRSGQPPAETPTPAAEAAKPAEQTDQSGAMFRIKKTNSGRDTREWTKTKFGRRVGDAHDQGMPEQVVAVNNKHTPGMPDEYVVNEISEILGPNAVELKSRDMTPEEIKAKQEKLRKDNEKLKEMGFPENQFQSCPRGPPGPRKPGMPGGRRRKMPL